MRTKLFDSAQPKQTAKAPCWGSGDWTSESATDRRRAAKACSGCPAAMFAACAKAGRDATWGVWAGVDVSPVSPGVLGVCPVCGAEFVGAKARRYCSRECGREQRKQRKPKPVQARQPRNCRNCGVEFVPTDYSGLSLYCGSDCRKTWQRADNRRRAALAREQQKQPQQAREQRELPRQVRPPRNCRVCGVEFVPTDRRGAAIYCGPDCKQAGRRAGQRQRRAALAREQWAQARAA